MCATLSACLSCEGPKHPKNDRIPELLCQPLCQRRHDCEPSVDVTACVNRCVSTIHARDVYDDMGLVEAQQACAKAQTCVKDVEGAVRSCWVDTLARRQPTELARSYCTRRMAKDRTCGAESDGYEHCIAGHKMYSDSILAQLSDCLDDASCRTYGGCLIAIVGHDVVNEDRDRHAEFLARPVPRAATDVLLRGTVRSDANVPIAPARVCVDGRPEIACAEAGTQGEYQLRIPAASPITLVAEAAAYQRLALPIVTAREDFRWSIVMTPADLAGTRSDKFGLSPDDPRTGEVFVAVRTAQGRPGVEGATVMMSPPPGKGPLYFGVSRALDTTLRATSSWSNAMFAGVPPGKVEITIGPDGLACVPSSGGWLSARRNSVTVPVVGGAQTWIAMRCVQDAPAGPPRPSAEAGPPDGAP